MLANGKMLSSLNGHYHLWMQPDGDLELYKKENDNKGSNRKVIWASRTTGAGDPPYNLMLLRFSNQLVVEDGGSNIIWSTGTKVSNNNNWTAGGYAIIQENGNFVLYDGSNRTMWTSDTVDGKKSSTLGGISCSLYLSIWIVTPPRVYIAVTRKNMVAIGQHWFSF